MHLIPEGNWRAEAQFKIKTNKKRIVHQLPFAYVYTPSLSSSSSSSCSTILLKGQENKQELHLKNKAPRLYRFQFHRCNPYFYSSLPGKEIKMMRLGLQNKHCVHSWVHKSLQTLLSGLSAVSQMLKLKE